MSKRPKGAVVFLALFFFLPNQINISLAAEPAAPFKPPWTEERVKPPETENQEPLAWCDNTRERKRPDGTVESYNDFRVTYANGTEVRHEYGKMRKRWIVIVPGPQGRTRTTYDLTDEKKPIRTVEEPGKKPVTSEWKVPQSPPTVVERPPTVVQPPTVVETPPRVVKAASTTQPTINIKPVTYGGPLDPPPVIHLDPGPETTPEEFVRTPLIDKPEQITRTPPAIPEQKTPPRIPLTGAGQPLPPLIDPGYGGPDIGRGLTLFDLPRSWDSLRDALGPVTTPAGTTGTPVAQTPGGAINIGSGWASATVPGSFAGGCTGGVEPVVDSVVDDLAPLSRPERKSTFLLQQAAGLARQAHQAAEKVLAAAQECDGEAFYGLSKKAKDLIEQAKDFRANVYQFSNPGSLYGGWTEEEKTIDNNAVHDIRTGEDVLTNAAKRMLGCTPKR